MKRFPFSFTFFVIAPIVIAIVYFLSYASSQYVVETKFVIQSSKPAQIDVLGAFAGLAGGGSSSSQDSYIAQEYILSAELLNQVDKELNIKEHYSSDQYDWWARLPKNATVKDFLEYWRDIIEVEYDSTTGISTLIVTAFSDDVAYNVAKKLLKETEKHVNKLTERSRTDMLAFAKKELELAENRLVDARAAITAFRIDKKDIDPEKTTLSKLEIVAELEANLSTKEAELANILTYMKPGTIKVRVMKNKILSLKQQINVEKKKWSHKKKSNDNLNIRVASYERLLAKKVVTEKLYESSLASLEAARLNAIQQRQYLEVVIAPYKPSEAEKPYVLSSIISVILGSFLFWVIGILIISAVRDH